MAIETPDILEIEQVCDFAATRLEQISEAVTTGDEDPLTDWEANCLPRVRAWLKQLKTMTRDDKIALATAMLDENLPDYELNAMLTLSTCHITEHTANGMNEKDGCFGLIVYAKDDYGWWILVPDADTHPPSVPDELDALLLHCRKLGISWLCLDRDGPVHPDFSTFDW